MVRMIKKIIYFRSILTIENKSKLDLGGSSLEIAFYYGTLHLSLLSHYTLKC